VLAAAFVFVASNAFELYRSYSPRHEVADDFRARKQLGALAPANGYVVATIETMPLFRRNSFYQLANSLAGNGLDGAKAMQMMAISPFSDNFTVERALRQIEAHPPDLIVPGAGYPQFERAALDIFLGRHAGEYFPHQSGNTSLLLRRR
jgi:hypothetical protein